MKAMTETRTIEIEFPIDAPVDAVWKALTDPNELTRWFPMQAKVEPGPGGSIEIAWGPEMQGKNRIRVWEPARRLQTSWFEPTESFGPAPKPAEGAVPSAFQEDPEAGARLLIDYILEGAGGRTILRMAHSGFSKDARWDQEYESHGRGWTFELRSLRNYLEHHLGDTRHLAWVRIPIGGISKEEAWSRLMSPEGVLREGDVKRCAAEDRYAITTVHGDRLEGNVILNQPPTEFSGTVENLDHSLMRCGIESYTGRPEATFWLSTWGGPERADAFRRRWNETLPALLTG